MSKQEILSWTSLATSSSFLFFYVLFNFGLPGTVESLFWIAVVVEIIVEISEGNKKVQKDERDFIIEAKGMKIGYNILVLSMVIALVQIFISNLSIMSNYEFPFSLELSSVFHFLILSLFLASAVRRSIMIYHYRKGY